MKKRTCIIFILALVFVLSAATVMSGYAVTVTQEEKDAADAAAAQALKATQEKKKEVKAAAEKAAAAEENYEEAEERLNELLAAIETKQAEVAETQGRMLQKQEDIQDQSDSLNDRLSVMYKSGSAGTIDVLLSSENVEDLLANIGMVHKILESDQKLLKSLRKEYRELAEIKAVLEEQELALEADRTEAQILKDKYQAEADKAKKMEEQLEADAKELAAEAAAKQAEAEAMIVRKAEEEGIELEPAKPGKYAWPTEGNWKITSNYGWRICPFHGREYHNGVDVVLTSGTMGSPVYAAADGVVTRASWYASYGNCIQIAMSGGYSTLYGHLSGYAVASGDFVKKGQLVGYIGSTGNSTGPHLHFTVFKNGSITNPLGLY